MADILSLDAKVSESMRATAVKVPLIFEPKTTAPVYFKGSLAAIPNMVF